MGGCQGQGQGQGQGQWRGQRNFGLSGVNPVRYSPEPTNFSQKAIIAVVDEKECTGCAVCEDTCEFSAIKVQGKTAVVDLSRCTGCGACMEQCPRNAITLKKR
jgi:NAD-dependent dihydropyrimidine dehydrogenase PreA subunit